VRKYSPHFIAHSLTFASRRLQLVLPALQLIADGAEKALGMSLSILLSGLVWKDDGTEEGKNKFATSRYVFSVRGCISPLTIPLVCMLAGQIR
jgi:hypothetical protein